MSPRSEESNAQIKDERREQILSAALRVFATRGFAATKISDIVSRAGMSHGLVYHYFRSKEEIFRVLVKRALETSGQSLIVMDQMPMAPLEKVRQTATYILNSMDQVEDGAYYFLIVTHASIMEGPQEAGDLLDGSDVALRVMAHVLEEGQKTGEIRQGNTMEMSMTFFAAIQGLSLYKLAIPDYRMPDPEILVNMVRS